MMVRVQVMVINFAVKESGLEAQLLAAVVKHERPELDRQQNDLVVKARGGGVQRMHPAAASITARLLSLLANPTRFQVCILAA